MMFARADGSRPIDERWHEARQKARRATFSLDEFGDVEIEKYDLDTATPHGLQGGRTPGPTPLSKR
jgi:hypothetical protein